MGSVLVLVRIEVLGPTTPNAELIRIKGSWFGLEGCIEIVLGSLFCAKSCMRWSNFERRHRHHPSRR